MESCTRYKKNSAKRFFINMKNSEKRNDNEFSDPSEFNPLITKLKETIRKNPDDPKKWIKLGCLYEERLNMVDHIARSSFVLRYVLILTVLISFLFVIFLIKTELIGHFFLNYPILFCFQSAILILVLMGMFFTRYPRSGSRFFKKAIALDPKCGEAYMHLGFVALRRFRKRNGCRLLEHALQLNVDDIRIKRKLKTIYEKEFITFFDTKKDEEKKQQHIIENQLEQIKKLQREIHLHKTNVAILKSQAKQTLSKAKQNVRTKSKKMDSQVINIKKNYEDKIIEIEKKLPERLEQDPIIYVHLTDRLFESEIRAEHLSYYQVAEDLKNSVELDYWQSFSKQTKYYLVTAEQTYLTFIKNGESKDFSLIGLEYCKALELEINKKFITPFVDYIKEDKEEFLRTCKTGERKNKPKYFGYLPMIVDEEHYPKMTTLTLGQFDFLLKRCLKGEYAFREYKSFLEKKYSFNGFPFIQLFQEKLSTVVGKYRNAIAHQSSMNKKQCEHVRELIFLEKNSLLKIPLMATKSV
jgi:hypothetical protein